MNEDLSDDQAELMRTLVHEALSQRGWPETQEECCDIVASIIVSTDDGPWDEEYLLVVAASAAEGLFGEAFESANVMQRFKWVHMMKQSLRKHIV